MKLILGLILCVTSLFLLVTGTYYGMRGYLQHDNFRAKLESWVKNFGQADSAIISHNIELRDDEIVLQSLQLSRQDSLQFLRLQGLELPYKHSELYNQKFHFTHAKLQQLDLVLDLNRSGAQLPDIEAPQGNIFDALLPRHYQLDQIRCKSTNVEIKNNDKSYRLTGFAIAAEPTEAASMDSWKIALRRGTIGTPFELVNNCPVESANINITPEGYTLDDCRILLSPGDIQIKAAYNKAAKGWTADIQSNKANIKHLLTESWKAKISGDLFCKTILRGDDNGVTIANGRLYVQKGVVEALPFLSDVKIRDSYPYRHLEIHQAVCRLTFPYNEPSLNIQNAWLYDDINIVSNGKIHVKGHIIIGQDGSLGGSLLVGLPQYVVAILSTGAPEIVQQLFNAGSDGEFEWVRVNLSGTVDDPQQDLSIRLEQIAGSIAKSAASSATASVLNFFGIGNSAANDDKDDSEEESDDDVAPQDSKEKPSLFEQGADSAKGLLESIF